MVIVRIVAIALAVLAAGCGDDTVLRIEIPDPGTSPAPTSLRVSLVGVTVAPKTIAPVTFPGTLVIHRVPSSVSQLCVDVEGLDGAGNVVVSGAAYVPIAAHKTSQATIALSTAGVSCATIAPDDLATGGPVDMAGGGVADLAGSPDLLPTGPDMTPVAICPPGSVFCDDFESGTLNKWSVQVKDTDMGSVAPSTAQHAHGAYSAHAQGSGASGADNYFEIDKSFSPGGLAPPLALRANVWSAAPLSSYTMVIALYDATTNGFSIGGDNNTTWVLTENQTLGGAPDRHSTLATPGPGWHCVELVVDAAGMVSVYVDGSLIIGPFQRISAVSYTDFFFGIPRTVVTGTDVFVDDVAIGASRLYCPP